MNSYALLNDAELALMLIALAGYPDDDLCRQGAVIEAELRSRHQGHYPDWFTSVQIAVCRTLQRHIPMNRASEAIPAFFDENRPIVDIIRQLHKSGRCLRWNSSLRTLEIIPKNDLPTLSRSTPVYP